MIYVENTKKQIVKEFATSNKVDKAIATILTQDEDLLTVESLPGYTVSVIEVDSGRDWERLVKKTAKEIRFNILDEPEHNQSMSEMASYNAGLFTALEILERYTGIDKEKIERVKAERK